MTLRQLVGRWARRLGEQLDPPEPVHQQLLVAPVDPQLLCEAALTGLRQAIPQVQDPEVTTAVFVFAPYDNGQGTGEVMGYAATCNELALWQRMYRWTSPQTAIQQRTLGGERIH